MKLAALLLSLTFSLAQTPEKPADGGGQMALCYSGPSCNGTFLGRMPVWVCHHQAGAHSLYDLPAHQCVGF